MFFALAYILGFFAFFIYAAIRIVSSAREMGWIEVASIVFMAITWPVFLSWILVELLIKELES